MSGLEILGAVATSISLVEAVKGMLRAVDFLRQNSAVKKECNNLRREILMIECFIMQAQQQTDPTMPAQRLLGPTEHPLVSLAVEELEDILNELNKIVEKYSNYRKANDPKRYIDKMKWFSEATKIDELRERSQAIKSNLHMAITFRVSSMVDHGNIRQEVLFHRVTQQLTHHTNQSQHINQALPGVPETSSSAYSSFVVAQKHCNRGVEDSGVVLSPSLSRTETVGRSMPLTTVTRQEESFVNVATIQSQSTHHPSILQEHIREGYRYFPDDKNESGDTLLERAIHNRSWETVRVLLGLWESLLSQQGLPSNSEPQYDSMGLVMEKFSSYIPEWNEIYSNDIHLEAMYPERTREGMSKAIREQPWAIDDWDDVGYSPIHYAVVEGNLEALDLLIKAKANINQHCSVQRKNIIALRSLVSAGASLTAISSKNYNILHFAAYNPDADMLNYIGKHNLAGVELEQRSTDDCNPVSMLHASWNRPSWRITDSYPRPSLAEMEVFITFYFDLLIPDLRRHMSTINNLLQAVKDRDVTTATEILDQLIERKVRCNQTDLVGWYRGLKGYVVDGGWDYLEDVLKDEYDETNEKIGRAAVARGKTINDPEMEEFF
ncbi:hypothetical protein SNK04_012016 [Fusarium graminearum]